MAKKKLKLVNRHHLTTKQRDRMPPSEFALPGKGEGKEGKGAGSYPIPDASHARNALARVSQHGTSEEKAEVRKKVHERFSDIGEKRNRMYTHARSRALMEK